MQLRQEWRVAASWHVLADKNKPLFLDKDIRANPSIAKVPSKLQSAVLL